MSEAIREGDLVLTPGEFGRVVGDASGSVVVVDHDGHCSVYPRDEVEVVVGVSERDAMSKRAVAAEQEAQRMRRELEALRDEMREWCHGLDTAACHRAVIYGPTIDRLDAILRGES
jgi:DNA/RNA-binding domain of Phe-tRNA-synthetase-like protein